MTPYRFAIPAPHRPVDGPNRGRGVPARFVRYDSRRVPNRLTEYERWMTLRALERCEALRRER